MYASHLVALHEVCFDIVGISPALSVWSQMWLPEVIGKGDFIMDFAKFPLFISNPNPRMQFPSSPLSLTYENRHVEMEPYQSIAKLYSCGSEGNRRVEDRTSRTCRCNGVSCHLFAVQDRRRIVEEMVFDRDSHPH